jgi:hypothetical protein
MQNENQSHIKTLHDTQNVQLAVQLAQHAELSNEQLGNALGSTLDQWAILGNESEKLSKINALIERFPKLTSKRF